MGENGTISVKSSAFIDIKVKNEATVWLGEQTIGQRVWEKTSSQRSASEFGGCSALPAFKRESRGLREVGGGCQALKGLGNSGGPQHAVTLESIRSSRTAQRYHRGDAGPWETCTVWGFFRVHKNM